VLDVADGPRGVVRVTAFAIAGTGIAQLIGWGVGQWLAGGALVDLFPDWHGERFRLFAFRPSRKHPPAKLRAFVSRGEQHKQTETATLIRPI
jgi:DNA-binding transcriptional LysR family regulator